MERLERMGKSVSSPLSILFATSLDICVFSDRSLDMNEIMFINDGD